jgi:hypothetical protein
MCVISHAGVDHARNWSGERTGINVTFSNASLAVDAWQLCKIFLVVVSTKEHYNLIRISFIRVVDLDWWVLLLV